jgi:putative glycosyltransferase (TIGR04372 family)
MFRRSPFVGSFPYPKSAADFELYNANPVLTFTEAEEDLGEGLLKDMGIPEGAWFVCFHVRDPSYEIQNFSESYWKESPSVYQNCSVANFIDAMRYIADCGGYAIRMGAAISDRLPDLGEARIIDYASDHRTDFGDIFLSAKCKFFVGTYSGLSMIANIFNVPSVKTNMFHHTNEPYTKRDLIIFKHHWSTEKSRMLTLSEMFELDMGMNSTQEYQQAGISVLENSPEEILAVTKEMNERLEGIFPTVKGDMELQQRFHALLEPRHQLYLSPAMAGAEYLRTQQSSLR